MSIVEYLDSIKDRLTTDALVTEFSIIRERSTQFDGYLRARATLSDGSAFEFSEYVHRSASGGIEVVTYSYHWADSDSNLIRRWDNTPHFPDLPGFPHHIHDGRTGSVIPGRLVSIFLVLDEIASA
ncbi:MAG: hypothetical protein JXB46_10400 [Candidatus Eisenbacteria bacterium]|nr:hypothetical protein [Candidatus Eisenbacteria bacterium]